MILEEIKRLNLIDEKSVLAKKVDPIGTEYEIVKDAIVGMSTLRIANRDILIPGMNRHIDLLIKTVAYFKQDKKKNVMPLQAAKSDDIVVEPIWRPQIFGLTTFTQTTPATVPAVINVIPQASGYYTLHDDELIVITDWLELEPDAPVTELQAEIDGDKEYPVSCRLPFKATDLHLFELDYPWIADVNLDIDGRAESASANTTLVPLGIHICLGKLVKALVPT